MRVFIYSVRVAIVLIPFLLLGCNQVEKPVSEVAAPPKPRVRHKPENQYDYLYAVLPFEKDDYLFKDARSAELTRAEIIVVDSLLAKAVTEHNQVQEEEYYDMVKAHPEIPFKKENYFIDLSNYRRQLIAVLTSQGEKEVWVNCLCASGGNYWRTKVVSVYDGGNCYFNVKVNLTKKSWRDLMVNGSA